MEQEYVNGVFILHTLFCSSSCNLGACTVVSFLATENVMARFEMRTLLGKRLIREVYIFLAKPGRLRILIRLSERLIQNLAPLGANTKGAEVVHVDTEPISAHSPCRRALQSI